MSEKIQKLIKQYQDNIFMETKQIESCDFNIEKLKQIAAKPKNAGMDYQKSDAYQTIESIKMDAQLRRGIYRQFTKDLEGLL